MLKNKKVKIGIIGCGAIGEGLALFIAKELKEKTSLYALADMNPEAAIALRKKIAIKPRVYRIDKLIDGVDLIIEAASVKAADYILKKAIPKGKPVIILSVGALIKNLSILTQARNKGVNIYVPSGAICGADGLGALSLGGIKSLTLTTSKPPKGLVGADYLKKKRINLNKLKTTQTVFKGSVKDAVKCFPKNINVAATLLLASSFKKVKVIIKADPRLKRNVHSIRIEAKEAKINIEVENMPSRLNPKTSALAILSTQYLLRKLFSSFKIGS